jgi:hypothetical protein
MTVAQQSLFIQDKGHCDDLKNAHIFSQEKRGRSDIPKQETNGNTRAKPVI